MMKRLQIILIIILGGCIVWPVLGRSAGPFHVKLSQLKGLSEASARVELAWSQLQDKRYEVFYQHFEKKTWLKKISLTNDKTTDNVAPSITTDAKGTVWIVWTVTDGAKSQLRFTNCSGQVCAAARQIPSPFSSNTGSSIAIDGKGTPWLVWSASDTGADAIVFSRWYGENWDPPKQISKEDAYPDILPIIGMDNEDNPWVYWSGYDGKDYGAYVSRWTGQGWSREQRLEPRNSYNNIGVREIKSLPHLPEFSSYPLRVAVHMTTWTAIQSLPVKIENE